MPRWTPLRPPCDRSPGSARAPSRVGAWAASPVNEMVAAPALPRIRRVFASISLGHPQTSDVVGGGYQPVLASTVLASTKQLDQMARINPVTPGGLGPHPAREPEPV